MGASIRFRKARAGAAAAAVGIALAVMAALSGAGWAAAGPWVDQEQARLRLLSAGQAAGQEGVVELGLHFQLRPGWKIYWRSPGDAGFPPSLTWEGSENLASAALRWPVPHRFSLFGLETFGYADEVVLPIDARLERPGEALRLRARVDYLVCEEICIPHQAGLRLDLPAGPGASAPEAGLLADFRARVPGQGAEAGLSLREAVLTGALERPVLQVTAESQVPFQQPDVLVEGPPGFAFGKPEASLRDAGRTVVLRVPMLGAGEGVLEGKRLVLTVIDGARGLEREVVARLAEPPPAPGVSVGALATILGLALLGGLILNLMPCVLPVLSIKLLSVIKQGGRARAEVRVGFLATSAGILASFLALAAAAIGLKALGLGVGWGIQFQQPLFLAAMALVVSLFAYNLFGLFEIGLPGWAGSLGGMAVEAAPRGRRLAGHFLTGAFATLLATPCSAPFLGTAVGFALARGPAEILLIFTALGLGLAAPYLAVAALPGLAARLPRPGPWMVTLRRILGLALAGTALWLISVLAAQVGPGVAFAIGALLLGLGLALWLGRAAAGERRLAARAAAALVALAALALPAAVAPRDGAATASPQELAVDGWRPFAAERIAPLVAEGKLVFVDVTADWCLTCQINKKLVLQDERVEARLRQADMTLLRGDWTLPDEAISRYLQGFGRYGIPFNAVYGPGAPDGLALPELLSVEAVLATIERAAGG